MKRHDMIEARSNGIAISFDWLGWQQIFGITLHVQAWRPVEIYASIHVIGCALTCVLKAFGQPAESPTRQAN